jgi:hypothetical protein
MSDISVTAELLDGVEQRTAYLLVGLEVSEYGAIRKANFDGTTTLEREPLELPSGRELLAHLLGEGRRMNERSVAVAKEAAICEMLLAQHTKEEGNN